jgi:hypothetical protein
MPVNQVEQLGAQLDELRVIMNDNIIKVTDRGKDLNELQVSSQRLHDTAQVFRTTTNRVQKRYFFKNIKMLILLIIVIIVILVGLSVGLYFAFNLKK